MQASAAGIQGGQDRGVQSAVPCKPPSRDVADGDGKKRCKLCLDVLRSAC